MEDNKQDYDFTDQPENTSYKNCPECLPIKRGLKEGYSARMKEKDIVGFWSMRIISYIKAKIWRLEYIKEQKNTKKQLVKD